MRRRTPRRVHTYGTDRGPRGLWRRLKRALGLAPPLDPPPAPPDEEPALVPSGPPRRPLGAAGVALELPREPEDVDARGREVP